MRYRRSAAYRRFAARADRAGAPESASDMSVTYYILWGFSPGPRARAQRCAGRALRRAPFMAVKAFPKRKGRFQLELWRRSWALPASDPSALVATRQSFEHSITDVLLRPWSRRARFKQYKRHRRTADILAETDAQNLEAFFSRPTTGILRLPTYAGANLRADRALSKISLACTAGDLPRS